MFHFGKDTRLERIDRSNQTMDGAPYRYVRSGASPRASESPIDVSFQQIVRVFLLAILLMVPTGTFSAGAQPVAECLATIDAPTTVTSVHVQPGAGTSPILDEINNARCSIDLAMYLFTSDEIMAGLLYAEQRGVHVRVMLEPEPFGTFGTQQEVFDQLVALGAEVQWSPTQFNFLHAKYMIVDGTALVITNQNFTGAGFYRNREFGVVTTDPGNVSEAVQIFEADWTGSAGPTSFEHLVVSPVNARTSILNLINSSQKSVWMYAEVLRDEDVTLALDNAVARGVDVRLLVNPSTSEDDVPYFLDALDHGVQVRVLENPYVHSKALMVDNAQVLIGSQNYSYTSLNLNREVGLILDDEQSIHIVTSTFESDWSRAVPVDTITIAGDPWLNRLTWSGQIGKLISGRWGVV